MDRIIEREIGLEEDIIYYNHAAVSPWPIRASEAVKAFAEQNATQGSRHYPEWIRVESRLRERLARLINAPSPDDIALLKSTSEGLSFIAGGLDWQAGDNVVFPAIEFPSNRYVWESLHHRQVETRAVSWRGDQTPEQALIAACDDHTRVLSVSAVQYGNGLRMNLETLGAFCRERGIFFCVDAIQILGALRFDVQDCGAHFVVADGHKWMMGPEGLALFYCQADLRERLRLSEFGWHMVEHMGEFDRPDWQAAQTARRFECGSPNLLGAHALDASLSLLQQVGLSTVEHRVLENTRMWMEFFNQHAEYELISEDATDRRSGIVTFRHRHVNADEVMAYLNESGVQCACRGGGVRFSPHFYQGLEEFQIVAQLLESIET